MKLYDNEKESINIKTRVLYNKKTNIYGKYHISFKCFSICISLFLICIIIYLLRENNILLKKVKLMDNFNNIHIYNNSLKILNNKESFYEPFLPENEKEENVKSYFKSSYNTSNIRYHFEDLFLTRKIFQINYSFHPYEKIDKSKSYNDNANYLYESTGMLNITKLDIIYFGLNNNNNYLNFNHIHLSMGHDANYITLSLVSIASILNTTNTNTFIHFHFVLLDSKFEDMIPIINLKKIYSNVEFIFYNGKQAQFDFSGYTDGMMRGIGDYTKFLIPHIVNNTNRIIILDSADIIAKNDLSQIYFYDLGDNYFGFTLDISAGRYSRFFIFARNKFYSNIGVCLVNVKLFRKDNLYMAGYFARLAYDNMPCPTQEMFFMISRYKIKLFPLIYNCPQFSDDDYHLKNNKSITPLITQYLKYQKNSPFRFTKEEIFEAESNQIITHLFTTKVLAKQANKKNGKIWINYVKLANVYDELKVKYPDTFKFYDD